MELIDSIDRTPVFTTFGKSGGNTATFSVLRDAGTIVVARLSLDRSGSVVVDAWKDGCADYPPTGPNSIPGAALPTIASAGRSEDTGLTGWTTGFDVESANDAARASAVPTVAVS